MTPPDLDLLRLLRQSQAPPPSGGRQARQRLRLVESVKAERVRTARSKVRWRLGLALGLGFTAATAAATISLVLNQESLEFQPNPLTASLSGSTLTEGGWIETLARRQTLEFSEGSRVHFFEQSKARIGRLNSETAAIMLESGKLRASIKTQTGIAWSIAAGPYRVHVVGTEFEVEWDFLEERFKLDVSRGRVRVSGGDLPEGGQTLHGGQSLLRSTAGTKGPASTKVPAAKSAVVEPAPAMSAAPSVNTSVVSPGQSWQQLARAGSYDKALELAHQRGMSQLLVELPADDLLLLANTARYAGDIVSARAAFIKLRERHAGHSASFLAAFSLGRLASDSANDPAEAARWFRVFLAESPRGDLAAGARARLMDTLLKVGDQAGAAAVARDYLTYHPTGPHSTTARSLVKSPKSR